MNRHLATMCGGLTLTALSITSHTHAADHREAPLIRLDAAADIADIYAFRAPADAGRLVLAMTVNGFSAPPENNAYSFSDDVRYSFHIDTTGDAVAETRINVTFDTNDDGVQVYNYTIGSSVSAIQLPTTPGTVGTKPNAPAISMSDAGVTSFAGQRDDPFFFDVVGFNRFLGGTGGFSGTDGFAGFNVSAIVIEVPLALVDGGRDNLQIWGTTERRLATLRRSDMGLLESAIGPLQQIERMGNPAINTALVPLAKKDLYNISEPANDGANFAGDLVASLQSLGTNEENINILASVAVPDTLKLNTADATAYPNGRAPADDVVDTLFFFIFNQNETPDGADANDKAFSKSFPYLAEPHQP